MWDEERTLRSLGEPIERFVGSDIFGCLMVLKITIKIKGPSFESKFFLKLIN